MICTNSKSI